MRQSQPLGSTAYLPVSDRIAMPTKAAITSLIPTDIVIIPNESRKKRFLIYISMIFEAFPNFVLNLGMISKATTTIQAYWKISFLFGDKRLIGEVFGPEIGRVSPV